MTKCKECSVPVVTGESYCLGHMRRLKPEVLRTQGLLCSYRQLNGRYCGLTCKKGNRYCRHHLSLMSKTSGEVRGHGIDVLGLSVRAYQGLQKGGVQFVSDLTPRRLKTLSSLDRIGVKTAEEIRRKVREWNASKVSESSRSCAVVELQPEPTPKKVIPDPSSFRGEIRLFQSRMKKYHGVTVAVMILPKDFSSE